jgi:hypothetical protein
MATKSCLSAAIRVTRCCEKIAQWPSLNRPKGLPSPSFVKKSLSFSVKSSPYFLKNYPRLKNAQMAKLRRIWSPWHRRHKKKKTPMEGELCVYVEEVVKK